MRMKVKSTTKLTRRTFLGGSLVTSALAPFAASQIRGADKTPAGMGVPQDPLTTWDPNLYLFVDDHWIASQSGLTTVFNQPEIQPQPIIWPDDPKTQQECAWGNVIREPDGRFRLWYVTMAMGARGGGGHEMARAGIWGRGDDYSFHPRAKGDVREIDTMLGKTAESTDGLHWTKPNLGLIEFEGNRNNNIVLSGQQAAEQFNGFLTNFDGFTILRDDQEPDPRKRYKMVAHWESVHCWDNAEISGSLGRSPEQLAKYWATRGEYLTFSPDGLRWEQPLVRIPLPNGGGDRLLVIRDHRHRRWLAYSRAWGYNAVSLTTSQDLLSWSAPGAHLERDPNGDHPDIESMIPFNYGNQDLGFLITQVKRDDKKALLSYLVSHHEGERWRQIAKIPEQPLVPSVRGSYHVSGGVVLHNEPFIVGDKLYIYFNAFSTAPYQPHPRFGRRSIGLAILRRDGFVGLRAAACGEPGVLTTKPIPVKGHNLFVNVELSGGRGSVKLELLDPAGIPIPGFGIDDATAIADDGVRRQVSFKSGTNLDALQGRKVRARIHFEGEAVIYAIGFSDG